MIYNYLLKSKLFKYIQSNLIFSLSILTIFLASIAFYFISEGNIRDITADFGLYYRPLLEIKSSNCKFLECADFFNSFQPGITYSRNWIVSPIYSIFFLLPITLLNSDLIFLVQGFFITLVILFLIRKILLEVYAKKLSKHSIDLIIFIGTLNSAFIKDSLSSGAMSICFLFILLGLYNYKNKFIFSIFLILASSIRPNYIYLLFTLFLALIIIKPKEFKKQFWYLIPSFISYLISFHFFYSSNPGSFTANIFLSGFRNFNQIYEYIIPSLPVNSLDELYRWKPSILEVFGYLIKDFQLLYMVIILYVFKIFHFLGFLGPDLIWDHRDIFIQRLPGLFYSLLINIPAFIFSILLVIYNYIFKIKYFSKWELTIIMWSLLYIFIHSFYLGDTRYLVGIHFIYVINLFRFLRFFYDSNKLMKKLT